VLYIKPDHLGDVLLATPVLAALRQRLPEARITALVGPWSSMVLERNPDVDTLLTCPFPGFERRPLDERRRTKDPRRLQSIVYRLSSIVDRLSSLAKPYGLLLTYATLLRAGCYDLAIVGRDDHWWGAALATLAGVPVRVGFAVPECRPFLTKSLPRDPRAHVTEQGLELVAATDQETRDERSETRDRRQESRAQISRRLSPASSAARFDPTPADIAWADQWLAARGLSSERLVIIHPGTGGPSKLWLAERWACAADALANDGMAVVLTGGPGEQALVAEVLALMRERAIDLAGQTGVGQLAALMRHAALVLGVDSGPLHLAAAQGRPSVHLYGPGDSGRFGPWGDPKRHVVVREELWCSPCGVFSACPRGLERPECMERIGAEQVVETAKRLLSRQPAAGSQQ
jgi:ADP-heptose:LPS heptosyltransferase